MLLFAGAAVRAVICCGVNVACCCKRLSVFVVVGCGWCCLML